MAIRSFLILFILFFFSSLNPILSLYEDQVGLVDWHQQYLGKVKQAVFHTHKTGRKRVVVSTEENVVALLDLRQGEIFWRHVLGSNDVIDGIDIALGKYVITLSSGGSILRAWNLPDGQMVWESSLRGPKHSKSLFLVRLSVLCSTSYWGRQTQTVRWIPNRSASNGVEFFFENWLQGGVDFFFWIVGME